MKLRIRVIDLITYSWLRYYAREKISLHEKAKLFGLHMDILRSKTVAYYNTVTDELEVKNPETLFHFYMVKFKQKRK